MLKKIPRYSKHLTFSFAWICLLLAQVEGTVWKEVTACYGSDFHCSQYNMECTDGTKIVLGSLLYGTKKDNQDCQFGISNCEEKEKVHSCCSYNSSDTFTPFSAKNLSTLLENCEGQTVCSGWAPRRKTTPYSSYVWIQYACVSDDNLTDMCQANTIVGTDLFVRFNMSNSGIQKNASTSHDCSCQISTPDCTVAVVTTLVDLDFHLPLLDASLSNLNTHSSACSSASLELIKHNKTYTCGNTQLYTEGHSFERMAEISVPSSNEIVSLRNINVNGNSGPSYIVLYFRSLPQQPLLVRCFEPGTETNLTTYCQTTTPQQTSLDVSTSSSDISSSSNNKFYVTNTHGSINVASTKTSGSSDPASTNTRKTADSTTPFSVNHGQTLTTGDSFVKSTSPTESISTHEHSSSSSSSMTFSESTVYPTTSLPQQISMDSPSTSRPGHPFSRPQSFLPTSILSPRPNQKSTTLNTDAAINPSTKYSQTSDPSTVARATDESTSIRVNASHAPSNSKSTSTSSISSTSNSAVAVTSKTTNSVFTNGESSGNMSTMITAYQSENTSAEETTYVIGSTAQTTGATTGKTIDDSENNNGLIIGVTVAVVLVILIIVAVVMMCLCIRIKRKEKIHRNYIRNTNIFYSFPEDYNDTRSTQSDCSPEADRRDASFSNIPRGQIYESVGNPSPSSNSPLYFDDYKIKMKNADETNSYAKEYPAYSVMPNDNNYVGETSNEIIDFVNGVEHDDTTKDESTVENGGKSVTFDPSIYYAQVRKEGKTKF